jgi:putative ATP-binding cassette transporter
MTAARPFAEVRFRGVRFSYAGSDAAAVGPFDFTLRPGEIVFVTGSNGGGKSTFMKLLAGLYAPSSGDILVDGSIWHGDDYRGLFSTVFTDFFLFDMLASSGDLDQQRAEALLQVFGLDAKVAVTAAGFTTTRLSTGQRKRLALIQAILEDRPILLLDEWTADQDPEFRVVFFETLLPELKREGRSVVAVTHDDRYFHRCDRLMRLYDGRIEERPVIEAASGAASGSVD